jgi:lipopolysaccharide/colanic/teichoic acid biosynthesis glycosyltransferase
MHLRNWIEQPSQTRTLTDVPGFSKASFQVFFKRMIDIVGALLMLVVLFPLFVMVAFLIKLLSAGPVFHVRERVGLHQRPFRMWKFRTMRSGSEKEEQFLRRTHKTGPFFKVKEDSRVFPLGRFLRKYSVDELPQLINVLKGDMSLVGPRPLFDFELEEFDQWTQLRRFNVKPGLTGLWQTSGRSDTSAERRMKYDLQYVIEWSLWMDLKILLKTIPVVLEGKGAV